MGTRSRAREVLDDSGFTLTELLVAMTVATVLGAMVCTFFLQATSASRKADGRTEVAAQGRSAMDSWSTLMRTAEDPDAKGSLQRIESLLPEEITFYAGLDNRATEPGADGILDPSDDRPPLKVRLRYDPMSRRLLEYRSTPETDDAGNVTWPQLTVVRVLAENVATVPGRRVFTGFAATDGTQTPQGFSISTVPVDAAGAVTAPGLPGVVGVEIAFQIAPGTGRVGDPAVFVNRITLAEQI
jgi:prepilin-type N-terminal cleavage/methylation domain-containing protein